MGVCSVKRKEVADQSVPHTQPVSQRQNSMHHNHENLHIALMDKEIRKKLQTIPISEICREFRDDNAKMIQSCLKISLEINMLEEKVCSIKQPTDIFTDYQNLLYPMLIELQHEEVDKIKSPQLSLSLLETVAETFHIIKTYAEGESFKFFSETLVVDQMKKKYNDLASSIKIEMIQTFKKIAKSQSSSNNPLMQMRFNTKHAIGMAKQKTLKDQSQTVKEEAQQYLEELFDKAINLLEEQPQYDEVFSLLQSTKIQDQIEKLQQIQTKFIIKHSAF